MEDRSKNGPFRRTRRRESDWIERILFSGSIIIFFVFVAYFIFSQKALNKYFELEEELEDFAIFKNDSLCNITSVEFSVIVSVFYAYLQLIGLVNIPLLYVLLTRFDSDDKSFNLGLIFVGIFKALNLLLCSVGTIFFL